MVSKSIRWLCPVNQSLVSIRTCWITWQSNNKWNKADLYSTYSCQQGSKYFESSFRHAMDQAAWQTGLVLKVWSLSCPLSTCESSPSLRLLPPSCWIDNVLWMFPSSLRLSFLVLETTITSSLLCFLLPVLRFPRGTRICVCVFMGCIGGWQRNVNLVYLLQVKVIILIWIF